MYSCVWAKLLRTIARHTHTCRKRRPCPGCFPLTEGSIKEGLASVAGGQMGGFYSPSKRRKLKSWSSSVLKALQKESSSFSLVITCFHSHIFCSHFWFSLFPSFPLSFLSPAGCSGLQCVIVFMLYFCCTLSDVQMPSVCVTMEKRILLCASFLSLWLVWVQQSRFLLMCECVFAGMWDMRSELISIFYTKPFHKVEKKGVRRGEIWAQKKRKKVKTAGEKQENGLSGRESDEKGDHCIFC